MNTQIPFFFSTPWMNRDEPSCIWKVALLSHYQQEDVLAKNLNILPISTYLQGPRRAGLVPAQPGLASSFRANKGPLASLHLLLCQPKPAGTGN